MLVGIQLFRNENWRGEMKTGTILSGLLRLRRSVASAAVVAILGSASPAFAQVYAPGPPPPLRHEVVPPPPRAGLGWRAGFWRWNGARWIWVSGHYARLPHPGAHWIPGHWARRPAGGWVFVEGHWS
jgi:hypothetical protein